MSEFNLKSSICTSQEQSERLLALGLKKETADMCWTKRATIRGTYSVPELAPIHMVSWRHTPAWGLHRLIEMMPRCIKCRNGYDYADLYVNFDLVQYRFYDADYMHDLCYEHFNDGDVYSNVIDCIEWLIKEGYFNKEYLV